MIQGAQKQNPERITAEPRRRKREREMLAWKQPQAAGGRTDGKEKGKRQEKKRGTNIEPKPGGGVLGCFLGVGGWVGGGWVGGGVGGGGHG